MKTVLLSIMVFVYLLIYDIQNIQDNSLSNLSKRLNCKVLIFTDDEIVDYKVGIKTSTKHIRFKVLVDTASSAFSKEFLPIVSVEKARITLARNSRQLASIDWHRDLNLTNMFVGVQTGDRIIFVFTLVVQRENGEVFTIDEKPITVPIK